MTCKSYANLPRITLVTVFLAFLLVGCAKEKPDNDIVIDAHPAGIVVYAVKDIPGGKVISSELLEERRIEQRRIPQYAVNGSELVLGRMSKSIIKAGQIICYDDLLLADGSQENKIILSKEEQQMLEKKAIKSKKTPSELIKSWVMERLKK